MKELEKRDSAPQPLAALCPSRGMDYREFPAPLAA